MHQHPLRLFRDQVRKRRSHCWLTLLMLLGGCGEGTVNPAPTIPSPVSPAVSTGSQPPVLPARAGDTAPPLDVAPRLVDVATESGIRAPFHPDAVAGRFFLPEVMGGGAAWLDFDRDGQWDLYVTNGCDLKAPENSSSIHLKRLFQGRGGGMFREATDASGSHTRGYGQGVAAGDFDGDGFPDIFLSNFGPDVLLHNNGDGTWVDATDAAGVNDDRWGSSAAWFDADFDGDLDLYVCNYLDVTWDNHKTCPYGEKQGYCGPGQYKAVPDRLWRNRGDGSFADATDELGFTAPEGTGLAVVVVDLDGDLRPEVYVANDMEPNFLFAAHRESDGRWKYAEIAGPSGCAVADDGRHEASMGVAVADFDHSGLPDIFLTHFYAQKNTLYRNQGELLFVDDSRRTRIAATGIDFNGFGTIAFDFDRDSWTDLIVANGHVLGPHQEPWQLSPQVLHNSRGRFYDVSDQAGPYFREKMLGRCVAACDYDNDGDLDFAVTHLDRPLALLRNDTPAPSAFIGFELRSASGRPPLGGRVEVRAGDLRVVLPVQAGGSYLGQSDDRLLTGLGMWTSPVDVTVFWPSGVTDRLQLAPGRYWPLREGQGGGSRE